MPWHNPYLFGFVAVIAIGVVVYNFVTARHNPQPYARRRRRPPSPPPSPPPPRSPPALPPPHSPPALPPAASLPPSSPSSSPSPPPTPPLKRKPPSSKYKKTSETQNFRRRNVNRLEEGKKAETALDKEQSVRKATSDIYYGNTDIDNYEKNVYEKILNDVSNTGDLNENIIDEDSDSENNVPERNNVESESGNVANYSVTSSNNYNNLSQPKEIEEEKYKEEVVSNLQMENTSQEIADSSQHHEQIGHIIANITLRMCSGCEENLINTFASPCKHSYLCWDCAKRVFRLYKKCSICHSDIEKFERISM